MINDWYAITHTEKGALVRISDNLGFFGPRGDDFLRDLGHAQNVELTIDSTGGSIFDASQIYEALKERNTKCVIKRAWSSAAFLAMAAKTISIHWDGSLLLHGAQGAEIGGPPELRKLADALEGYSQPMIEVFVCRARKPANVVKDWLSSNKFFTPQEALQAGLIDKILPRPRAGFRSSNESSSASSSSPPTEEPSERLLLDLLGALGTVQTADKTKLGRELSQWFANSVREV